MLLHIQFFSKVIRLLCNVQTYWKQALFEYMTSAKPWRRPIAMKRPSTTFVHITVIQNLPHQNLHTLEIEWNICMTTNVKRHCKILSLRPEKKTKARCDSVFDWIFTPFYRSMFDKGVLFKASRCNIFLNVTPHLLIDPNCNHRWYQLLSKHATLSH